MRRGGEVLDIVMQSSAVDLFHACGIAVAPLPRSEPRAGHVVHPALVAMIDFNSRGFTGTLAVCVPDAVFAVVPQNPERRFDGKDWIREMANQLLGRVKGRLLQLAITLQATLPSLVDAATVQRLRDRSPFSAAYRFRTLRGEIVVSLLGDIDPSIFVYTGTTPAAVEGDIIVF